MLSTRALLIQPRLARQTLAGATLLNSHLHRDFSSSTLRSVSRTSKLSATTQTPSPSLTEHAATSGQKPTRAFQPHFKDAAPSLPSSPDSPKPWTTSRPHENWVMTHPVYKPEDLVVDVVHFEPRTFGDHVAHRLIRIARWGFDVVSGYKHASPEEARAAAAKDGKGDLSTEGMIAAGYFMTEAQWVARILFLETIAGVPGFTAGILRHLRSLRLMKRDGGWVNTLLQEAENERMHLLTFMKIRDPSAFFRLLVLATQGVFFNLFFVSYMLSPQAAHRFVGYLEEEACKTYTHIIGAIERGEIPEWDAKNPNSKKVPQVAKDYWRLPDDATMLDLVKAVRADEAGHRFTNHTLANLRR
ncbi:hypothetical protein JCM6882_005871 [Rhodosporidiobolus microsporus]